jgi:hypothetical protein
MKKEQYISIAEYAERTGTSRQAVYKKLSTSLQKYVKVIDKKKMLNIQALEGFNCQEECQQVDKSCQGNCQPVDIQTQQLINMLQAELDIKNHQIKELNERLAETNKILDQEQQLNAINAKKLVMLEDVQVQLQKTKQSVDVKESILAKEHSKWIDAENRAEELKKQLETEREKTWLQKLFNK